MVKRTVCLLVLFSALFPFFVLPVYAVQKITAEDVSKAIQDSLPAPFGYVDNTSYTLSHKLASLSSAEEAFIVVCAESTNFSEFGVFCVADARQLKQYKAILGNYLEERKQEFKNGVIYNAEEYPKFEHAAVFAYDHYVFYTILNKEQQKIALTAVKQLLK